MLPDNIQGRPVVTRRNWRDVVDASGIDKWRLLTEPEPAGTFLQRSDLTPDEERKVGVFSPKVEVYRVEGPGGTDIRVTLTGVPYVSVIGVVFHEGVKYVPIVAEYKFGNRKVTVVPPTGVQKCLDRGKQIYQTLEEAA